MPDDTGHIREIIRSLAFPLGFAAVSISAGTAGHVLYLPTLEAYSDTSTVALLSEGLFRSLGFLVLSMGTIESANTLPYILLTLGRVAGFLFFFYAAVAGAGLIFAKRLRPARIELWSRLQFLPGHDNNGHVVVCGIGDDGYAIATNALATGRNVVAIDKERNDRTKELEARGAIVLEGDAAHESTLTRRARLQLASEVYVTTESDATNGAIVEIIRQLASGTSWAHGLEVTARIDDHRLRRVLHDETSDASGLHLRTYDVSEATARELLAAHPVDEITAATERVHIWLVGWTSLTQALVNQLLHRMHYPDSVDRQITIITETPTQTKQDLRATFPGIHPDWWSDESMSEFVTELFPPITVRSLPESDMELLSNHCDLYGSLGKNDRLTIIADDADVRSLRALISVWGPKLNDLTREYNLDTQLLYRSSNDVSEPSLPNGLRTASYTDFYDGCSMESVLGEDRDSVARRLALVYHLLYEEDPVEVIPNCESVPDKVTKDIDSVFNWLMSLSPTERERYATAVWRDLPEYQRESNRYAAAHTAVKHKMVNALSTDETHLNGMLTREIAESEHRRWCAEKILDGWEPLPGSEEMRWETDSGEQALRNQRYHPAIRSVESLRTKMVGEWEKDVNQVRAVLQHPEIVLTEVTDKIHNNRAGEHTRQRDLMQQLD